MIDKIPPNHQATNRSVNKTGKTLKPKKPELDPLPQGMAPRILKKMNDKGFSSKESEVKKELIYQTLLGILGDQASTTTEFKSLYSRLYQTLTEDPEIGFLIKSIIKNNHKK